MDVRFEHIGCAGVITLDRCDALNAVSQDMVHQIYKHLKLWESDQAIAHVIIRSNCDRAFSAGGDLREIYDNRQSREESLKFFKAEYQLNAYIKHYPKPYVALIDGIVMGGGVGISIHGSHRVMGQDVMFAMPEVTIGFFPDVGGSYFLSRLNAQANNGGALGLGLYLGLTGERLKQGDCLLAGLASHTCSSDQMEGLFNALTSEQEQDVNQILAQYHNSVPSEVLEARLAQIEEIFSKSSLIDVISALKADESEWAEGILNRMLRASPTSLQVAFQQIRLGKKYSMAQAMAMEYGIASKMLCENDFYEGIYRVLIDKNYQPNWHPKSIAEVDLKEINAYFEPVALSAEFE
jgi:enoyl-CoA hydratase